MRATVRRSERRPGAKLTPRDVKDIWACAGAGDTSVPTLARRYSVSSSTIRLILTGENWKHITINLPRIDAARIKGRNRQGSNNCSAKLTDAQVADIRRMLAAGQRDLLIARQYGVHKVTISQIRTGRTWRQNGTLGV